MGLNNNNNEVIEQFTNVSKKNKVNNWPKKNHLWILITFLVTETKKSNCDIVILIPLSKNIVF